MLPSRHFKRGRLGFSQDPHILFFLFFRESVFYGGLPRVEGNLTYQVVQFFAGTPLGPSIMVQPLLALLLIVHRICSFNFVGCLVVLV